MSNDLEAKAHEEWEKNVAFCEKNIDLIRKQYGEKTLIVVKDQQIIDSGEDVLQLMEKHPDPNDYLLITSYERMTRVVHLPSPRLVGKITLCN